MNIRDLPEREIDPPECWVCEVCGCEFYSPIDEDEDEICNQCLDFDG